MGVQVTQGALEVDDSDLAAVGFALAALRTIRKNR
jgi:hypothetical protein